MGTKAQQLEKSKSLELDIVRVVEESALWQERRQHCFRPVEDTEEHRALGRSILADWEHHISAGNKGVFESRLQFEGIDQATAELIAAGVRFQENRELPGWARCLEKVVARAARNTGCTMEQLESRSPWLEQNDTIPFSHLLSPFVEEGNERLQDRVSTLPPNLMDPAWRDLQRFLLSTLSVFAATALHVEFAVHLSNAERNPNTVAGYLDRTVGSERRLYAAFTARTFDGGLLQMVTLYPVLFRALCEITLCWVDSCSEFLHRLNADRLPLAAVAGVNDLGRVARIRTGLSDRHNGGRTVFKVEFENGAGFIYKPKCLEPEKAYYAILDWLNQNGASLPFRILKVLCRQDYGWAEALEPAACKSAEQARRYFHRAGMVLCLAYLFGANDLHQDNILAVGEDPMLIDLETLLCPEVAYVHPGTHSSANSAASQAFYSNSVFRTAMLPRWYRKGKAPLQFGGLADVNPVPRETPIWESVNTDRMRSVRKTFLRSTPHLPSLEGKALSPAHYVAEIVSGFDEMYRLVTANSSIILSGQEPFTNLSGLKLRLLFRDTGTYAAVQQDAFNPRYVSDGMAFSIRIDALSQALLGGSKPLAWPVLAFEHACLSRCDIPVLYHVSDDDFLYAGSERIQGYCRVTGLEAMRRRLTALSDRDRELQMNYIRSAFATQQAVAGSEQSVRDQWPQEPAVDQDLIAEALSIAEQIRSHAITGEDGTSTWITRAYDTRMNVWQVQPMDLRFYDGTCGTALFLAAVERVAPGSDAGALAEPIFDNVIQSMKRHTSFQWMGIGAGSGVPSVAYALAKAAALLDKEAWLGAAEKVLELVTLKQIDADTSYDVMIGSAGCMLACLTVEDLRPAESLLAKAIRCGDHLLAHRVMGPAGYRAWPTSGNQLHTGFAHGVAGIAYALCRLFQRTGEERFLEAALEACRHEDSLFVKSHRNWANSPEDRTCMMRWCHGAPGIGLGRCGMKKITGHDLLAQDIDLAVQACLDEPLIGPDHLCCGKLGRAETLMLAGRAHEARRLAAAVVARARNMGQYRLGGESTLYISSFHQGMAGIGYILLRIARPDQLPCLLLWG